MLSRNSKELLADCLIKLAECSRKVEEFKNRLCECEQFSVNSLFGELDSLYCSSVGSNELKLFARPPGKELPEDFWGRLVSVYDRNGDGRLDFAEFSGLIVPFNNPFLKSKATSREEGVVSLKTQERFIELLETEHRLLQEAALWREKLESNKDFNVMAAYRVVQGQYSCIEERALWSFFEQVRVPTTECDIRHIIERLARTSNGVVSYSDFVYFFSYCRKVPRYSSPLKNRARENPVLPTRKPLNFPEDNILRVFSLLAEECRSLEYLLRELIECPDFNLDDAYRLLDPDNKGWVSPYELVRALERLGVTNSRYCELLLTGQKLDFNSFYRIMTPVHSGSYAELRKRRPNKHDYSERYDQFSLGTSQKLCTFFETLIAFSQKLEKLKENIEKSTVHGVFSRLDPENTGSARFSALELLLNTKTSLFSQSEIEYIMRKLDRNRDGKVSSADFAAFFY